MRFTSRKINEVDLFINMEVKYMSIIVWSKINKVDLLINMDMYSCFKRLDYIMRWV